METKSLGKVTAIGLLVRYLKEEGVEYVVLRTVFFAPEDEISAKEDPVVRESRARFYEELVGDDSSERVASFRTSDHDRPGYDLEIWRVGGPAVGRQSLAEVHPAEGAR